MVQRIIKHFPCIPSSRVTVSPLASVGQQSILNTKKKQKKNSGSKYYSCQSFQRNSWETRRVEENVECWDVFLAWFPSSALPGLSDNRTEAVQQSRNQKGSERRHIQAHSIQFRILHSHNPSSSECPLLKEASYPHSTLKGSKDAAEERAVLTEATQSI